MSDTNPPEPEHVMLTFLGIRAFDTRYYLGHDKGRVVRQPLTPLATLELLDVRDRPNRVIAFTTDGTTKPPQTNRDQTPTWELFESGVRGMDLPVEAVRIPDGTDQAQLRDILRIAAEQVPVGAHLTLDVTQGLRHFPFLLYALALYLVSLKDVTLRGAYYGMIEGIGPKEDKPIIDLKVLLELPQWFYAVRLFKESGLAGPIAGRLEAWGEELVGGDAKQRASKVKSLSKALREASFYEASALPVELGGASKRLAGLLGEKIIAGEFANRLPLGEDLVEQVRAVTAEMVPPAKAQKTVAPLDEGELARQATLIGRFLYRGQVPTAVTLLREWFVSQAIFRAGSDENRAAWLDKKVRGSVEGRLGRLGRASRGGGAALPDEQQRLGRAWEDVGQARNEFAHHGMGPNQVPHPYGRAEPLGRLLAELPGLLAGAGLDPPNPTGGGTVLVTPLGLTPGVVYSALIGLEKRGVAVDRLVVIGSDPSLGRLPEAVERSGYGGEVKTLAVADALAGFAELHDIVRRAKPLLADAGEVFVNLTGGPTCLGVMAQAVCEAAAGLGKSPTRFALVDRRPPQEQRDEPFVAGEFVPLPRPAEISGRPAAPA